jgi:hypothetical protein
MFCCKNVSDKPLQRCHQLLTFATVLSLIQQGFQPIGAIYQLKQNGVQPTFKIN